MIERLIHASLANRGLVLTLAVLLAVLSIVSVRQLPLDAIPDLSDVQVIIRTPYAGQAPQIIEDQVTYPITTRMLAVPRAKAVRGFSMYGDSFVYVLFEDGTDLYWARSRVLEYLSQVRSDLPEGVEPQLGPDATGVGWVYQYALVDRTGKQSRRSRCRAAHRCRGRRTRSPAPACRLRHRHRRRAEVAAWYRRAS